MAEQPIFRTIREQIVYRLRDDIMSQIFPAGENMREFQLSKRYGVSRSPIRDALLQLTQEGLLVATPNCGVRVASKLDQEIHPLVVEIRRKIESFALERMMEQLSEEGVQLIRECLESLEEACRNEDLPSIVKGDMGFHGAIVKLAGIDELLNMWQPIIASMMLHYDRLRGDWMESYREHKAIFDAIVIGDIQAAKESLAANIK